MHEAMFYQTAGNTSIICRLCNHFCHIPEGKRGLCGVRENRDAKLYSLVYGQLVAANTDPVEKKPLFHFLPGSSSYSISTVGCNFRCLHCQNHAISQYSTQNTGGIHGQEYTPASVVEEAVQAGCSSISYTYVEPTVFYEFAYSCATMAHDRYLKNIFVSNGYMAPDVSKHLSSVLDGINIDIKAFTDDFYKKVCKARLQPVLDNVQLMHKLGVWVEVTTLLIPGLNDSPQELRDIARFIKNIAPDIPWHVTAFHPTYKMRDRETTPAERLRKARNIGLEEGLSFVYVGNTLDEDGENTYCPSCGLELISRSGFAISRNRIVNGHCCFCGKKIAGVWDNGIKKMGKKQKIA